MQEISLIVWFHITKLLKCKPLLTMTEYICKPKLLITFSPF